MSAKKRNPFALIYKAIEVPDPRIPDFISLPRTFGGFLLLGKGDWEAGKGRRRTTFLKGARK
jgi:hypothetical protein